MAWPVALLGGGGGDAGGGVDFHLYRVFYSEDERAGIFQAPFLVGMAKWVVAVAWEPAS